MLCIVSDGNGYRIPSAPNRVLDDAKKGNWLRWMICLSDQKVREGNGAK